MRDIDGDSGRLLIVEGDPARPGAWQQQLAGTDAIVSLAGEPVAGGRWTDATKQRLARSRIDGMRQLVDTLSPLPADRRPQTLVAASAVGYYGSQGDVELDESAGPGQDFLARLCVDWELGAEAVAAIGLRVVRLRLGVVLGEGGGALEKMVPAFRAFVGGAIGSGDQYVPWVHLDDVIGLILLALDRPEAVGPVNVVAPEPATMKQLARALGAVMHRPTLFSVPAAVLKLMMGEAAQVLLGSQRVVPKRARELGFRFHHPNLTEALRSILR
jgi:uncharacterized protein (TIGR01777 family)